MATVSKKGIFITFEGPEGSGKSSHIRRLAAYLKRQKRRVVVTREPGGTSLSSQFRNILLNTGKDLTPLAELFLYEADRAQHMEQVVKPALAKGAIVLCDRHTDSTLAYQGFGRGLNRQAIATLNAIATGPVRPILAILLDVPVKLGLARAHSAKKNHDRLERAGLAF